MTVVSGWRTSVARWTPGLVAVVIAVALLALFAAIGITAVSSEDVKLYRRYGESIADGAVPFRDIAIEYPPAAVALFVLPALVTQSYLPYAIVFAALVGGFGMAGLLVAARIGTILGPPSRNWLIRTLAAAAMIGLLGAVALTRFDFVPAALTVVALYAVLADRFGWAGVLLGAAVAVKLYPAVVVPVAAVYVLQRSGKRPAAAFIGLVASVVVATYLPFVLIAPEGLYESQRAQIDRALHVESSAASLLWLAKEAGLAPWPNQATYYDLHSRAAEIVAAASALAGVTVLGLVWWRHARGPAEGARLVRHAFASVAAIVVFGKVFSPQYLLWLVLLVPALRGTRVNAVAGLLAAATIATALYFPRSHLAVVWHLAPQWMGVIVLRNLFLLAALLALLVGGARRRTPVGPASPSGPHRRPSSPV